MFEDNLLNKFNIFNISIGTHNSGAISSNLLYDMSFISIMNMIFYSGWANCQTLTLKKQVEYGVNMFDLRYFYNKKDESFVVSHTFPTIYTLYIALTDIFETSATLHKQLITIKLEHDNGIQELFKSPDKPDINLLIKLFKSISYGHFYKNLILPTYNKSFNLLDLKINKIENSPAVLLYSNNYDPELSFIIHNESDIFDSINTWYIVLLSDVKSIINNLNFKNNGYPKILHLTWNAGGILTPFVGKYALSKIDINILDTGLYGIFIDNIGSNHNHIFDFIFNILFIVFYGLFMATIFIYIWTCIYRLRFKSFDLDCFNNVYRHRALS